MHKIPFFLSSLLILIIVSVSVNAAISDFELEFNIFSNKVYVEEQITFEDKRNYTIKLPSDAKAISLWLDDLLQEKEITQKTFLVTAKKIKIAYLTKEYLENQNFLIDLTFPDDIKNLEIKAVLSEDLKLAKPIDYSSLTSNAVFPRPTKIETDGQRLIILWERNNIKKGDSISLLVIFKKRTSNIWIITSAAVIIVVLFSLYYFILKLKRLKVKEVEKKVIIKEGIEKHLKEDEAAIIRILKQREGQCEQGTLRVITGFSKAKLSGLLKELEERKIIYKEKRGKKNLIFLK